MASFYVSDSEPTLKWFSLGEEESNHCIRVLRKKVGERIEILNGRGHWFEVEILEANPKKCLVRKIQAAFTEPSAEIHLAIAPTKQMDRIEWLIEKGTELGCSRFSFIQTKRTERSKLALDRLNKIAISAMKQSKRHYLPVLEPLVPLSDFVKMYPGGWLAHCLEDKPRVRVDASQPKRILIGPEGDFAANEIVQIRAAGYTSITLGEARLRTETAGLKAIFLLGQLTEHR